MTKQEATNLYRNLNRLGDLKGVKFAYAVSKNINLIKTEIDLLEKAIAPSEEYKKVDELRVAICEKYAKKDENGKVIIKDNAYDIEDTEAFEAELKKLKEEYKKEFDARDKQVEEYNELLKSNSDIELYKISIEFVPETITTAQMHGIMAIVDDSIPTPFK